MNVRGSEEGLKQSETSQFLISLCFIAVIWWIFISLRCVRLCITYRTLYLEADTGRGLPAAAAEAHPRGWHRCSRRPAAPGRHLARPPRRSLRLREGGATGA